MSFIAECRWVHEDHISSLPRPMSEEEYTRMFESSRVIDGVRMFPAVTIRDEQYFIMGYDDEMPDAKALLSNYRVKYECYDCGDEIDGYGLVLCSSCEKKNINRTG